MHENACNFFVLPSETVELIAENIIIIGNAFK